MELIHRHLAPVGQDLLDHFPVTVIQGARQVGKSTLADVLTADRDALVFTLDDASARAAVDADPEAFIEQNRGGVLVVDEVQLRPELLRTIKASVDRDRRPGRFLLTGSADVLRARAETDSLAGRAATLRLRGLSMGEVFGRADDFVAHLAAARRLPRLTTEWDRASYVQQLALGGFPEVRRLPQRLHRAWLDSYLERILERDAVTLPGGGHPGRISAVARLLAANQAGELVKGRVAEQAHIPASSITSYLDALKAIFLVDELPPWAPNLTRREVGRAKAMIDDPALALRLAGLAPGHLESLTSPMIGGFLEAFVVGELLKQRGWSEVDFRLFHYRDRDGLEVDVVVELGDGRFIAIEVKAASAFKADHFRTLRILGDRLGDRLVAGVVLATAGNAYQYADRLWGLPISALWEL